MTFCVLIIKEGFQISSLDWAGRVGLGVGVWVYFHLVKFFCDFFPPVVIGTVYTGKKYEKFTKLRSGFSSDV